MTKKEEQVVELSLETEEISEQKRGWIFDEIVKVGQLEAGMAHADEQICNIYSDMELEDADLTKLADELSTNYEILKLEYENRTECMRAIFDAIPNSDYHYWCRLKHAATVYAIAGENFHARGCSQEAEESLKKAGKALALICSLAFGFEPMDCLRCLDERMKK